MREWNEDAITRKDNHEAISKCHPGICGANILNLESGLSRSRIMTEIEIKIFDKTERVSYEAIEIILAHLP